MTENSKNEAQVEADAALATAEAALAAAQANVTAAREKARQVTTKTEDKTLCVFCHGSGYRTENRTELDTTSSIIMGSALGLGLFPRYRTVTERVRCSSCLGRGER